MILTEKNGIGMEEIYGEYNESSCA
jgi:hypothetical protein